MEDVKRVVNKRNEEFRRSFLKDVYRPILTNLRCQPDHGTAFSAWLDRRLLDRSLRHM